MIRVMETSDNSFTLENQSANWGGTKLWTLTFDLQGEKVNKFSKKAIADFEAMVSRLEKMGGEIDALIFLSGKPNNFIAGADIEVIRAAKSAQEAEALARMGQKMLDRWEDLPFPTVVA